MSISVTAIRSVVSAAVTYLLHSKGVEAAGQQAATKLGELGGAHLVAVGQTAIARLREVLGQRGEAARKAKRSLTDVEDDPTDTDYQDKLTTELDKLAANDADLRALLEQLSTNVARARETRGAGTHSQTLGDNAQMGAAIAGDNSGTVNTTFNNQRTINADGSYIEGGVTTGGGDFIGRDKIVRGDEVRGSKIGVQRNVQMGSGDYSEGTIDKRSGAFVSGGTVYGPVVGSNSGTISSSYGSDRMHQSASPIRNAIERVQQAQHAAQQRGNGNLADDLNSVIGSLNSARKAEDEGNTARRAAKLREAQTTLHGLATTEPSLNALIQQLDRLS